MTQKQDEECIEFSIKDLQDGDWALFNRYYNLEELKSFMNEHKVEVLRQDDYAYHCYIDYKQGDGSWYCSYGNPLTAIVVGIKKWKEHNEK